MMASFRLLVPALSAGLVACTPARPAPAPAPLPTVFEVGDTATEETALAGCVRLHHVWKRQAAAVRRTDRRSSAEREVALVEEAYRPYAGFWKNYAFPDEASFRSWLRSKPGRDRAPRPFDVTDPRMATPFRLDPRTTIVEMTERVAQLTGAQPCSDWYLVYGPGWANLAAIRGPAMLVDFFGMPRESAADDFRLYLPHEAFHVIAGVPHAQDADNGTLLERILSEGSATYFNVVYWGPTVPSATTRGFTDEQWQWALDHERELWGMARPSLSARSRNVLDRFMAARVRLLRGAPGRIGYFLGYRIAEAYVARHGDGSWRDLIALPYATILAQSGYQPAGDSAGR